MTSSKDSISEKGGYKPDNLSSEDQRLFLQEKDKYVKRQINDSPLLDQLCLLHLIIAQLSEGYTKALADFEEKLGGRTKMLEGWRQSKIKKVAAEFESPMPWLHPFKLAAEELQLLQEELEAAVMKGETEEKGLGKLREVMDKYQLQLPLPSHLIQPRYLPRSVRVYK